MSRVYLSILCLQVLLLACYESSLGLSVPATPLISSENLVDAVESDLAADLISLADMQVEVDQLDEEIEYTSCLILQDSCPDGYKCALQQTGEGACVESGALGEGSVCGLAGKDDCNRGLLCVAAEGWRSEPETRCYRVCDFTLSEGCSEDSVCSELSLAIVPMEPLGFCL